MPELPPRRIVIVGGGSAGWMAAAALGRTFPNGATDIRLVESEEIGTVGVGEATIPPIRDFNAFLGVHEDAFLRETQATIKLGIEFVGWGAEGARYFHPFGRFGEDMEGVSFHHYWLRHAFSGGNPDIGRFNLETLAARAGRFGRAPGDPAAPNYAYQFDAALYAAFLRRHAEARGVMRIEGRIVEVRRDGATGDISAVVLDRGAVVEGDLFVDASGFRGLLIEEAMGAGYDDWSAWLPCNRAVAVPTASPPGPVTPFTRATADGAGWRWRIPLQHRVGNGYVFCDRFLSEDAATARLLETLDAPPLKEPKVLRFTTGRRRALWVRNVVAIGLAGGFLEPLESTSLHLTQVGITKLLALFPRGRPHPADVARYNREMAAEYDGVKDFLIAHYRLTTRDDTPFWAACRAIDPPDSLKARLEAFRRTADAGVGPTELFKEPSWVAVLLGQGFIPRDHHPVADALPDDVLKARLARLLTQTQDRLARLPTHDAFLAALHQTEPAGEGRAVSRSLPR